MHDLLQLKPASSKIDDVTDCQSGFQTIFQLPNLLFLEFSLMNLVCYYYKTLAIIIVASLQYSVFGVKVRNQKSSSG